MELNLEVKGSLNVYMWYLWPFIVEGYFGVIQCTHLKRAWNSKTAVYRVKRSEIWKLWAITLCVCVSFDVLVFQVILGLFGEFVSKWLLTQKLLSLKPKWLKFGSCGLSYYVYGACMACMGYLWPFSVQSHFGVIWCTCLKMACNSKTADRKQVKFGTGG